MTKSARGASDTAGDASDTAGEASEPAGDAPGTAGGGVRSPGGAEDPGPDAPAGGSDVATDGGLFVLALIWGVNFSVIKVGLEDLPPLAFNALRFPLAAVVLYLLLRRHGPIALPRREDLGRLIGIAVIGHLIYQFFFIFGMDATLAGNASILLATVPVWTIVLSTLLGHERPPPTAWAGVVATLVGMVLVVTGGEKDVGLGSATLRGDLLMVGAAVLWASYTVAGRNVIRTYGPLRVTAWTMWIGTAGLVVLGLPDLAATPLAEIPPIAWGAVGYAGVLGIGVAYLIWYWGVQRIGSSRTAVYSNLVPVVALVVAWLWLGETPTLLQLTGAAVVIGGMTAARLSRTGGTAPAAAE